jgi:CDGSH-type Zn-finger protein
MSDKPTIAGKAPIKVSLEAGKKYAFCTCGLSEGQPFCDGKHTGNEPRCDGTHKNLD